MGDEAQDYLESGQYCWRLRKDGFTLPEIVEITKFEPERICFAMLFAIYPRMRQEALENGWPRDRIAFRIFEYFTVALSQSLGQPATLSPASDPWPNIPPFNADD